MKNRRNFIKSSAFVSVGFLGLSNFFTNDLNSNPKKEQKNKIGYGDLLDDPNGLLKLPKGFSYKIISIAGNKMDDGLNTPGKMDAMGTFALDKERCIIVRNHEIEPEWQNVGAFGHDLKKLNLVDISKFYDFGFGIFPGLGGTSTIIYNTKTQTKEKEYMSLLGTERNCAGGVTPWNSWITCEETVSKKSEKLEKDHGYCFEVKASKDNLVSEPIPLKAMGRFNHEAVAIDPRTGIVYLTEDRHDSCIYRFIPNEKGNLHKGGKLQALKTKQQFKLDSRNWIESNYNTPIGYEFFAEWIDLDNVESPNDDLRLRAQEKGAAIFARGEGMWFGDNELFWCCTNGGKSAMGQIFKYIPSIDEGKSTESKNPGKLSLYLESPSSDILQNCDNLTVSPWGDLVVCEDTEHPFLRGITPMGEIYNIAENIGADSELAGAVFSPDGSTLFMNIQHAGLTLAIQGPWRKSAK